MYLYDFDDPSIHSKKQRDRKVNINEISFFVICFLNFWYSLNSNERAKQSTSSNRYFVAKQSCTLISSIDSCSCFQTRNKLRKGKQGFWDSRPPQELFVNKD